MSTRALRAVLRRLGYDAHGWGLGRNIGPTAGCVKGTARPARPPQRQAPPPRLADRLEPGRHLRPRPGPPRPRLGPPGRHPRQPLPAGQAQPEPGDEGLRPLLAPARRAPHAAARVGEHPADRARDVDLLALRRHRALADLPGHPGRALREHRRDGQPPGPGAPPGIDLGRRRPAGPAEGTWKPFKAPLFLRPAFPKPAQPTATRPGRGARHRRLNRPPGARPERDYRGAHAADLALGRPPAR